MPVTCRPLATSHEFGIRRVEVALFGAWSVGLELTDAHARLYRSYEWGRRRAIRQADERNYINDTDLGRMLGHIDLLGLPCDQTMTTTRDGQQVELAGFGQPAVMRAWLIQVLTGRRDHRRRHRRIGLQQLPNPRLDRVHDRPRRPPLVPRRRVASRAAFTVFFEHPTTRAITLIGMFSDRRNRRISAQSSTDNTSLPSLARLKPGSKEGGQLSGTDTGQFHA